MELPNEIWDIIYQERHKLEMKEICKDIHTFNVNLLIPPYDCNKYKWRYKDDEIRIKQKLDLIKKIQQEFYRKNPHINLNIIEKWSRVKLIINWCKISKLPHIFYQID
jgi:hypothetical protein